jgi:hypothetical protein
MRYRAPSRRLAERPREVLEPAEQEAVIMVIVWRAADRAERVTVLAYVLLDAVAFVIGVASHSLPYKHATLAASIAAVSIGALINAGVLVALVLRRRWAWFASILIVGGGVIAFARGSDGVLGILGTIVASALLASPPMRRYVAERQSAPSN